MQKRFEGDKQRQAQEQMRLYKESGINPANGPFAARCPDADLVRALLGTEHVGEQSSVRGVPPTLLVDPGPLSAFNADPQ